MGTLKKKVNKYILLSPLHCRPFQVFESLKTAVHTYTPTKKEGLWKKNVHSFSKLLPDPPGTTWCTVHRRRSPHETKMTRRRKASLQRQDIPFFFFITPQYVLLWVFPIPPTPSDLRRSWEALHSTNIPRSRLFADVRTRRPHCKNFACASRACLQTLAS